MLTTTHNGKYDADETVYADIADEPLATYTTAVNDCDVYDGNLCKFRHRSCQINGNDTSVNIKAALPPTESIGALGRLEVWRRTVS